MGDHSVAPAIADVDQAFAVLHRDAVGFGGLAQGAG
jgi:hypothetical protein